MASTASSLPFVQNTFTDNWTQGFPGQLRESQAYSADIFRTYVVEETNGIPMGRGIIQATLNDSEIRASSLPFTVRLPINTDSPDITFVGVTIRPQVSSTNVDDGSTTNIVAGNPDKDNAAVVAFENNGVEIYVRCVDTPVFGDAVYMVNDTTNSVVGDMYVGEFTTQNVPGTVLLPNVVWSLNVPANTNLDQIGAIRLARVF